MILATTLAPAVEAQGYQYPGQYPGQGQYPDQYQGQYPRQPYPPSSSGRYPSGWDARGEASRGGEMGRTVGGTVGLAAGMLGGAALASAVVSAGAVAAMGPLAVILIGSAITLGGGFVGSKLLSHGGQKLTEMLGKQNTWMMIGAVAGTIAALALIPALGPFAGAGGLVVKGLIGGVVGGVLGRLFSNQLEALATPRNLMTGIGGVLGGLAGGIPGAVAGAAGGFALGSILDDHFFAKPGDSINNYLPIDEAGRLWDRVTDAGRDVRDWTSNRMQDGRDMWNDNWYENQYNDPYYQHGYQYAYADTGRAYGPDTMSPTSYVPADSLNYGGQDPTLAARQAYSDFMAAQQQGRSPQEIDALFRRYKQLDAAARGGR